MLPLTPANVQEDNLFEGDEPLTLGGRKHRRSTKNRKGRKGKKSTKHRKGKKHRRSTKHRKGRRNRGGMFDPATLTALGLTAASLYASRRKRKQSNHSKRR